MKTVTTRANIATHCRVLDKYCIRFSYCGFSNYCGVSPDWYNHGVYGWNWDAWSFDDFVVVDGYRSFPAGIDFPNEKEFNEKMKSCKLKGKAKISYINRLLHKYIDPIVKK